MRIADSATNASLRSGGVEGSPALLFERGVALYRQGAFEQSDGCMRELLKAHPQHFDALHLRGLIAARGGSPQLAAEWLKAAIDQNSSFAPAHRHLGNALRQLGRLDEAVLSYDRAIELRPDFKEAHVNRAMTLLTLRRAGEALTGFEQAITLGADDAAVHTFRASALIDLNRPEEALAACEKALAWDANYADASVNRGAAHYRLGAHAAAAESSEIAIRLQANHAEAHAYRGAALHAQRRPEEALAALDLAVALQPQSSFAHHVRALCLLDLQRAPQALQSCDAAIALRAELADAHNTRGLALADALRFEEAIASFDRAIDLQPELAAPYFNKGVQLLRKGDFARGWELYERRPMMEHAAQVGRLGPRWDGSADVTGKTVYLDSEQGLGDTLQFCRYALLLAARGARVVLAVQAGLVSLLQSLGPAIRVVSLEHEPPPHDLHCPLLSLPLTFGTRFTSIPSYAAYLHPDPARVALWRRRLGTHGRLIGVRWQGSTGRADAGRSFALNHLESLARVPGVRLISLQKGMGTEQLLQLERPWVEDLGEAFEPDGPDAFLDVAAVMASLDLVITSDTSIAHLAGALGVPTWLALKRVPDWRWFLGREDSPWYRSMRLFRQHEPGGWTGVFQRMHSALEAGE